MHVAAATGEIYGVYQADPACCPFSRCKCYGSETNGDISTRNEHQKLIADEKYRLIMHLIAPRSSC